MKESLPACPLCGAGFPQFEPFVRKQDSSIVRCGTCRLIFVNPRENSQFVAGSYREDRVSKSGYYSKTRDIDRQVFSLRLQKIASFVRPGRVLDVGCNVGTFLEAARDAGWEASGVEPNVRAASVCRFKKLEVFEGLFGPELVKSLQNRDFNLVCFNDSIEHFPDPLLALRSARDLLLPGGFVALTTPDIESLFGRLFQIKPEEHLFYFSRDTISRALEQCGFDLVFVQRQGRRRDISAFPEGANLPPFWIGVAKILRASGLDRAASRFLETFFPDELFALARRKA
jgi:SAM-dependent methyltransferase